MDFAEVHDCFTIAEIIDVEDLGFFQKGKDCKRNQGWCYVKTLEFPINPSGGLKSKGHPIGATGIGQIVEVYEQFSGKAGERTIKNAKMTLTRHFWKYRC